MSIGDQTGFPTRLSYNVQEESNLSEYRFAQVGNLYHVSFKHEHPRVLHVRVDLPHR